MKEGHMFRIGALTVASFTVLALGAGVARPGSMQSNSTGTVPGDWDIDTEQLGTERQDRGPLDSQFFHDRTLRSLTYAAPFAAPLAYTGLGLLLIVNRMVKPDEIEWAQWVLLLALGGFAGNLVFSLSDHAMNGFHNPAEWVPVVSSAQA
jgi:hypothetical protein